MVEQLHNAFDTDIVRMCDMHTLNSVKDGDCNKDIYHTTHMVAMSTQNVTSVFNLFKLHRPSAHAI